MIAFSRQNGVAVLQCINEDEDALEKIKDAMDDLDIAPVREEAIMDEILDEVSHSNRCAMSQAEFMDAVLARMEGGERFIGKTHYTSFDEWRDSNPSGSWSSSSSSTSSSSTSSNSSSSSIVYDQPQFFAPARSGARWGKGAIMNVWQQIALMRTIENFNANIGARLWKDT